MAKKILVNEDDLKKLKKDIDGILKESTILPSSKKQIRDVISHDTDLQVREKEIFEYIKNNPGVIKKHIEDAFKKKPGFSKKPVLRIISMLEESGMVVVRPDETNSLIHHLFVNYENVLASVVAKLDDFIKSFLMLFRRSVEVFNDRYSSISTVTEGSRSFPNPSKLSEIFPLTLEALNIFHDIVNVYNLSSIVLWPGKIRDKDTLYKLYTMIFRRIVDTYFRISEILSSLKPSIANANITILKSKFLDRLLSLPPHDSNGVARTMTDKFIQYYGTFCNFGMEKQIETVLNHLWDITSEYRDYLYTEGWLSYSSDYKYEDGWKKLIELKKQHVAQTSPHFK
jgi:hypothetical protein